MQSNCASRLVNKSRSLTDWLWTYFCLFSVVWRSHKRSWCSRWSWWPGAAGTGRKKWTCCRLFHASGWRNFRVLYTEWSPQGGEWSRCEKGTSEEGTSKQTLNIIICLLNTEIWVLICKTTPYLPTQIFELTLLKKNPIMYFISSVCRTSNMNFAVCRHKFGLKAVVSNHNGMWYCDSYIHLLPMSTLWSDLLRC